MTNAAIAEIEMKGSKVPILATFFKRPGFCGFLMSVFVKDRVFPSWQSEAGQLRTERQLAQSREPPY